MNWWKQPESWWQKGWDMRSQYLELEDLSVCPALSPIGHVIDLGCRIFCFLVYWMRAIPCAEWDQVWEGFSDSEYVNNADGRCVFGFLSLLAFFRLCLWKSSLATCWQWIPGNTERQWEAKGNGGVAERSVVSCLMFMFIIFPWTRAIICQDNKSWNLSNFVKHPHWCL